MLWLVFNLQMDEVIALLRGVWLTWKRLHTWLWIHVSLLTRMYTINSYTCCTITNLLPVVNLYDHVIRQDWNTLYCIESPSFLHGLHCILIKVLLVFLNTRIQVIYATFKWSMPHSSDPCRIILFFHFSLNVKRCGSLESLKSELVIC